MKSGKRVLAMVMGICLLLNLGLVLPIETQAASDVHTITLSSTLNADGSYSHSAVYDGVEVTEYDYTWHADPSTVHTDVSNSPAEYYTGTQPGNDAVYVAHDIYYYPELDTSGFTRTTYDGEQEWVYHYTAEGYTGYIFSTLPGRSSLPTDMMHSEEEAYKNAVLHITQPGDYVIEGTWHGQIWVDLANYCDDPFTDPTARVNLILNGVTIDCTVAAGLVFYNVYECDNTWEDKSSWSYSVDTTAAGAVVTLADGTVNSVSGTNIFRILKTQYKSGSTSVQKKRLKIDGSFYSYQSMNIQGGEKGTGILNITAGYEGLNSELHLSINGGNVNIFSQDDGINVNEDNVSVLTVSGGNLHILAGLGSEGDGIDSNGYICVNGGTIITMANPGADSGMDSDFGTYVFGGNVIAMGSTMDWVENDTSVVYDQATMNLQFSSSRSAGDAIVVTDTAGNGIFAYDPDKDEINGSQVRTYTGAVVSCENFVIGESYHVYIGGEVTGTENMGVYDMTTVTAVTGTNQQSYSGTSSSGGNGRPSMGGSSSGATGTGNTTFTLSNNVSKFTGVANYSTGVSITVTPMEGSGEVPAEKTYYLFGYINGANYACEEDYENMGAYQFVDGKLTATFTADSYVAVKEADNANWYMAQTYCTDTTCNLYNTTTGAAEKMFVPGNVEVTFTLTENADGTLTLGYTTASGECSHSYTGKVTTAATCTMDGVKTYTCANCGDTYTEVIAATGHSYTGKITTAATCTTDGVKTYTCANCGDTYTEAIAATGHSYAGGVCTVCGAADPNGSTTVDGSYVQVTDVSEITAGGQFVIVADHSGAYYAMDTDISSGKASGVKVTLSDNVVVGTDLPVWTVEAVTGGVSLYGDGAYLAYTSGSSGGGFGGMSGNNFTASATAYTWTVSAGESGYSVGASSGSRYIYFRTSSSVFGPYSSFNSFMGGYITELLFFKYRAAEQSCTHSYTGEVTTAAGCETDGVMTYTCANCGDTYTEAIAATGHNYNASIVAATCTQDGSKTYTCANCGDSYSEAIAATGHNYTASIVAATCTQDGSKTYTCANCGDSYGETIPATGHSYSDGVCTVCGEADPDAVTPAKTYYLFGYINGANYACEEDYQNMGDYPFVNGKLTATFAADSYVAVKEADNAAWYMTNGWQGTEVTSAILYNTNTGITADKLYVPGGVEVTFTLVENADGTLTLSYTTAAAEPSTQPTVTLKYPTLTFEDVILMNVYFSAENLEDVVEMGLITYLENVSQWNVESANAVIPGYTWSEADGLYYATTNGIAAKDLGDEIYFAVYAKLADGTYYYTRLVPYSPRTYAYSSLSTGSASMKPIVVAMLNYGAAAQSYFNYKTDTLVNGDLTADQKALVEDYRGDMVTAVSSPSAAKQGTLALNGGYAKRYPTVSFEGAFCINYYATPSVVPVDGITMYYWSQEDYDANSVLTLANATAAIAMTGEGTGEYHAAVEGIAAKDLSRGVYVCFVYSDGTTTYYSGVLAYSIGTYCAAQASGTGTAAALAKATAVYGYYANELFNK